MTPPQPQPAAVSAALVGIASTLVALGVVLVIHFEIPALRLHATESVIFGVLTPAILVAMLRRRKLAGRSGAIASLATLGWLPLVFTRVGTEYDELARGRVFYGTLAVYAFSTALMLAVSVLFTSILLATKARHPRFDTLVRRLSVGSVIVVGLATATALTRIDRPDLWGHMATLRVERTLSFGDSLDIGSGSAIKYVWWPGPGKETTRGVCALDGVSGASVARASSTECEPLSVAHDQANDVWIVFGKLDAHNTTDFWVAFTPGDRRARGLEARDYGRSIAPPLAWTAGGVVGSLVGLALLALAHGARVQERSVSGVEGALRDGWVTLESGPPIPLTNSRGGLPPPGPEPTPVLLQLRARVAGAYREPGASDVVSWTSGTLESAREALRARATMLYAFAMTSSLLAAAPLLLSALGWTR